MAVNPVSNAYMQALLKTVYLGKFWALGPEGNRLLHAARIATVAL